MDHVFAERRFELARRATLEAHGRRYVPIRQARIRRAGLPVEARPIPTPDTGVFLDVDCSLRAFTDRSRLICLSLSISNTAFKIDTTELRPVRSAQLRLIALSIGRRAARHAFYALCIFSFSFWTIHIEQSPT
jgi:hypothetical protein